MIYKLKLQMEAHRLTISETTNKIKHIQDNICPHPHEATETVNYEERVGRIIPNTIVCGICGILIRDK